MVEFTTKQKHRHDLVNLISNNQAMVYLEKKSTSEAINDSCTAIKEALTSNKIDNQIYNQLSEIINNILT